MKRIVIYLLALVVFSSCNRRSGSGTIVTETRQTGDFTGIDVGGAFNVELRNGAQTEVKVEADDNVIAFIETEVSDNVLHIRTKNGTSFNDAHFKVYIIAPDVHSIDASGAANVKANDPLKSNDKITLEASGAAGIAASVDAPEVSAEITGAGNMELSGRTRDYKLDISGSGNLKSADLKSENTDAEVSGAGNAWVHASVKLKADASGAGNIYYKGGANVEAKTSGAGNVHKED